MKSFSLSFFETVSTFRYFMYGSSCQLLGHWRLSAVSDHWRLTFFDWSTGRREEIHSQFEGTRIFVLWMETWVQPRCWTIKTVARLRKVDGDLENDECATFSRGQFEDETNTAHTLTTSHFSLKRAAAYSIHIRNIFPRPLVTFNLRYMDRAHPFQGLGHTYFPRCPSFQAWQQVFTSLGHVTEQRVMQVYIEHACTLLYLCVFLSRGF